MNNSGASSITVNTGQMVNLSSTSSDPDGDIAATEWDAGFRWSLS